MQQGVKMCVCRQKLQTKQTQKKQYHMASVTSDFVLYTIELIGFKNFDNLQIKKN